MKPGPGGDEGRRDITLEEIEDAVVDGDSPISTGTAASALRHRTFRIVFFGAFASNIGTWMQNVVLGAYAYNTTHSSTFVGVIIFAQLGPGPRCWPRWAVCWPTRSTERRFLIVLSLEQLVFSLGLALVVAAPSPSHVLLVLMVVMVGVGNALYAPTYSAILPGLVGREDMPGAIALNSAQMNASRVIGPVIGSVAYHFVGPAWVFAGNAVTYLFVIAALMVVTLPAVPMASRPAGHWRDLWAGVDTARADRSRGALPGHRLRLLAARPGLHRPDAGGGGAQPGHQSQVDQLRHPLRLLRHRRPPRRHLHRHRLLPDLQSR